MFVDSDDWLHYQALEVMLQVAYEQSVSLVMALYQRVAESEQVNDISLMCPLIERIDRVEGLLLLYDHMCTQAIACAKLYHHSLWKEYRFPIGKINEDEYVTYKLIYAAEQMVYVKANLYYYRQHNNSIMANSKQNMLLDFTEALWERQMFFTEKKMEELMRVNVNVFVVDCIDKSLNCIFSEGENTAKIKELKDYLRLAKAYDQYLTMKNRLKYALYLKMPAMYVKCIKTYRKMHRVFVKDE